MMIIFERVIKQVCRMPLALLVLSINGVITGLLHAEIFHDVCKVEFSWKDA